MEVKFIIFMVPEIIYGVYNRGIDFKGHLRILPITSLKLCLQVSSTDFFFVKMKINF